MNHSATLLAAVLLAAQPALVQAQATEQSGQAGMTDVIGMSEAIGAAEKAGPGRALEAEMEWEKGRLIYEIELASEKEIHNIRIDASSGEVVSRDRERLEGMWQNWFGSDKLQAVNEAPQSLAQLVQSVEKQVGGEVREVSIDKNGDNVFYEMELETDDGREREVMVEVATGRIMPAVD